MNTDALTSWGPDTGNFFGVVTLPADAADTYRARMIERGEIPLDGERCEWCGQETDEPCSDECDCPECDAQRAEDDHIDMWIDNAKEW